MIGWTAVITACAAGQREPAHTAVVGSLLDSAIVATAERAVRAAAAVDRAWPGFWNPPTFAIYRPDTVMYLFVTEAAPAGFKRADDPWLPAVLRDSWFVLEGSSRGLRGGSVPVDPTAKRLAMAVRLPQGPMSPLEFLLHESFHGWQFRNFADLFDLAIPQHLPDSLRLPADTHELLEAERRLLIAAIAARPNDRQAARDYVEARITRLSKISQLANRIERAAERREGTAEYVGLLGALAAANRGAAP